MPLSHTPRWLSVGAERVRGVLVRVIRHDGRLKASTTFQEWGGSGNIPTPKKFTHFVEVPAVIPIALAIDPGQAVSPTEAREFFKRVVLPKLGPQLQDLIDSYFGDMPGEAPPAPARNDGAPSGSAQNPVELDGTNPAAGL